MSFNRLIGTRIPNMIDHEFNKRRELEALDSKHLARHQLDRLNNLIEAILPHNRLYGEKLADVALPLKSLDELAKLPFTYKEELVSSRDAVANQLRAAS